MQRSNARKSAQKLDESRPNVSSGVVYSALSILGDQAAADRGLPPAVKTQLQIQFREPATWVQTGKLMSQGWIVPKRRTSLADSEESQENDDYEEFDSQAAISSLKILSTEGLGQSLDVFRHSRKPKLKIHQAGACTDSTQQGKVWNDTDPNLKVQNSNARDGGDSELELFLGFTKLNLVLTVLPCAKATRLRIESGRSHTTTEALWCGLDVIKIKDLYSKWRKQVSSPLQTAFGLFSSSAIENGEKVAII
ncbi:hypothetical protein B0H14DRAFT_2572515 [Mycena olivaceomarginata]|nr:hypothetical protein B0H14DRAFT_2572515 [Mycena olivaceomarginata]